MAAKIFGFLREVIMAGALGTTNIADAYKVVYSVPDIIFAGIVSSIGTTFIPIYSSILEKDGEQKGNYFTNNILNIVLLLGLVVSVSSVVFSRQIISIVAPGFFYNEETIFIAIELARVMFFIAIFLGAMSILLNFLNANKRFLITSVITIPYSVVVIIAFLLYSRLYIGVLGLAYASLIGMAASSLMLFINSLCIGYRYRFKIDFKDRYLRKSLKLALPLLVSTFLIRFNIIFDRMLASGLGEGSIAALNYAQRMNELVTTTFVGAIIMVMYTMVSKYFVVGDIVAIKSLINKCINSITIILVPVTFATVVLNEHIVRLLFERGAFDQTSTNMTASALMFYSVGLIFIGYRTVVDRAFYAMNDTKTPMINAILFLIISVVFKFLLVRIMGHNGLALSTSIAFIVATTPFMYSLRKKLNGIGGKKIIIVLLKAVTSATVMSVAIWFVNKGLRNMFARQGFVADAAILIVLMVVGVAIYFILMAVMKTEEVFFILSGIKSRLSSINFTKKI
ncbi:MAG: murein biosynthesis integral membrane protein MurJ [Defluviitaleaceae bacterium]|nr:murein biosynthesis integral membrane protein MurJ [Defluviitaleaceae bacterium]